ncbi:hypothetical protein B0T14DRAFT_559264 [Immersiella caudata]|uniref:Uncharacterized protein n=1 Tax=Immersiella caudata TaxID=314043 RepID=A0AA39XCL6_9PEZI|nr:hypothetical protein B0T14DRAFT_559264 [Immersiella caudata]
MSHDDTHGTPHEPRYHIPNFNPVRDSEEADAYYNAAFWDSDTDSLKYHDAELDSESDFGEAARLFAHECFNKDDLAPMIFVSDPDGKVERVYSPIPEEVENKRHMLEDEIVSLMASTSWNQHSFVDDGGLMNTYANLFIQRDDDHVTLPGCNWKLFSRRSIVDYGDGPDIRVTDPDGVCRWPDDCAYYAESISSGRV